MRASTVKCFPKRPLLKIKVFLNVSNDPAELFNSRLLFLFNSFVLKLILPPNDPAPLAEVPTPLCTCMLPADEAISGISTKKVPRLSASL